MVLVMEVAMMAIKDVKASLSAEATTARSLVLIITRRMIAVRNQVRLQLLQHQAQDGESGRDGASALKAVEEEHGQGHGSVEELTVDTPLSHKIGSVTPSHAVKGMAAKHTEY